MFSTCCCERPSGAGHSTGSTLKQSTSINSSDSSSSKQADFLSKKIKKRKKEKQFLKQTAMKPTHHHAEGTEKCCPVHKMLKLSH